MWTTFSDDKYIFGNMNLSINATKLINNINISIVFIYMEMTIIPWIIHTMYEYLLCIFLIFNFHKFTIGICNLTMSINIAGQKSRKRLKKLTFLNTFSDFRVWLPIDLLPPHDVHHLNSNYSIYFRFILPNYFK